MPHMVGKNNTPRAAVARRYERGEIVATHATDVDSPARARRARHRGWTAHGTARGPRRARPGAGRCGRCRRGGPRVGGRGLRQRAGRPLEWHPRYAGVSPRTTAVVELSVARLVAVPRAPGPAPPRRSGPRRSAG